MTSTDPLPNSTTPPPTPVILYDGNCRICERESGRLVGRAGDGDSASGDTVRPPRLKRLNFHEPGVLDRFPGITHDQCMQAMVLIDTRGRIFHAAEAVARALAIRSIIGRVALLYYIPGVRQLCDHIYRWIAERRYRISGCPDGACDLHRPER